MRRGYLTFRKAKAALTLGAALAVTLVCAAAALAAHPTPGAHYSGTTHQKQPISFDVSSNGSRLIHPKLYLVTGCNTGFISYAGTSNHNTATASTKIKQSGKFKLVFHEKAKTNTGTAHATFTVKGQFTSTTHARGTARVTVHYTDGDFCVAHHVHFTVNS